MSYSISSIKYSFIGQSILDLERVKSFLKKFWKLNRVTVSEENTKVINYIYDVTKALAKSKVISARSGEQILSWIVPKNWQVFEASLLTKSGKKIADFNENPLFLWSYSVPYQGIVSKSELKKHIYTIEHRPFEIPYHYINAYRYNVRDWGFSLPGDIWKSISRIKNFYVNIKASLDEGELKIVDIYLPGRYKDTICFFAHTCHPAQVSDGLANVSILLEIFYWLSSLKQRKYSYRFIFGPEYFSAALFLSKASPSDISFIKAGLYLDMLSNNQPLAFQRSSFFDSPVDQAIRNVLRSHTLNLLEYSYRSLWGNDEMFYESPPYNIPVSGLGRLMHREYHFSSDNFENINFYHIKESVWILQKIIQILENDCIPYLLYHGPLYLSRYSFDKYLYQSDLLKYIEQIQWEAFSGNPLLFIAEKYHIDFFELLHFFEILKRQKLCRFKKQFSHFNYWEKKRERNV